MRAGMKSKPSESRRTAVARLAGALSECLAYEREEGARAVEVDPALLRALASTPAAPAPAKLTPSAAAPAPGGRRTDFAVVSRTARVAAAPPAPAANAAPAEGAAADAAAQLEALAREVRVCTLCPLHKTRGHGVPGQGCPRPDIVFIGEGPGSEEDRQGLAFVGPAGQILTRLITRMGFTREQVFIANIVKCRPTVDGAGQRDRPPTEEEMAACLPYLRRQLAILKPRVIVSLGNTAIKGLLGLSGITRLHGQWLEYDGIPLMPTYHPSYLLRNGGMVPTNRSLWEVWDDMQKVLVKLGRPVPPAAGKRP